MKNCKLLIDCNNKYKDAIKNKLIFKDKHYVYPINVGGSFIGDHLLEMINVINYVDVEIHQKVPIVFLLGEFQFYDKLVYVILESIVYYLNCIKKHKVDINFKANHNIWTEGIRYSPLLELKTIDKTFLFDLKMKHFRKYITDDEIMSDEFLSKLFHNIYWFLKNNDINESICEQLSEALIELVGNAKEHGNTECLIDIDITDTQYKKTDNPDSDELYVGMNAVVLNYSSTLFYEPLKNKLNREDDLNERYKKVMEAREYHFSHLSSNYKEDDFYSISSFQDRISGNKDNNVLRGRGLTKLLESLDENSDTHLCYMLSGNRILFFDKSYMKQNEDGFVGFNKERDYLKSIPDEKVFTTINTFFPGVAYNLNYAIKKE